MLDTIDPFYKEHAAQYFQLLRASLEPLLIHFSIAGETALTDFALGISPRFWQAENISFRERDMQSCINSRCIKRLLEVRRRPDGRMATVQYLHKTVMEFLEHVVVRRKLESYLKTLYDPKVRLLAAIAAKSVGDSLHNKGFPHMRSGLLYASRCHPGSVDNATRLLDRLDSGWPKKTRAMFQAFDFIQPIYKTSK